MPASHHIKVFILAYDDRRGWLCKRLCPAKFIVCFLTIANTARVVLLDVLPDAVVVIGLCRILTISLIVRANLVSEVVLASKEHYVFRCLCSFTEASDCFFNTVKAKLSERKPRNLALLGLQGRKTVLGML